MVTIPRSARHGRLPAAEMVQQNPGGDSHIERVDRGRHRDRNAPPSATPSIANAAAMRRMLPKFSGSCTSGQTANVSRSPRRRHKVADSAGGLRRAQPNTPRWKLKPTICSIQASGTTKTSCWPAAAKRSANRWPAAARPTCLPQPRRAASSGWHSWLSGRGRAPAADRRGTRLNRHPSVLSAGYRAGVEAS